MDSATKPRAVVVTGCSSGIGRAVALRLLRAGYAVHATARRVGDMEDLARAGAKVARVDVTDATSVNDCVREVEAVHGPVWGLVNNAGYALAGPVEDIGVEQVRHQFEVNVFGALRMAHAVLPGMRSAGEGRIVNISSVAGRFSLPGGGCYHASKHALTCLSDTLRLETRPFGVRVSTVEPAAVNTAFIDTALRVLASSGRGLPAYRTFRADLDRYYRQVQSRPRRHGLGTPQTVAAAVERALSARTPRPRYVVGAAAHLCLGLHDVLPRAWFETVVRLAFPLPGPGG
ncbi:oxidoreductase [Streptomyces stramineus]|uniref:Oxidoreductase n=1 Tax=Streptomyces stramineus TaxID=173861 RepID=A0ABN1A4I7_9ACTN